MLIDTKRALLEEFPAFGFGMYNKFELMQKCAQYLMSKFVSAMVETEGNTLRNKSEILDINKECCHPWKTIPNQENKTKKTKKQK